jgi:hypothetical protein
MNAPVCVGLKSLFNLTGSLFSLRFVSGAPLDAQILGRGADVRAGDGVCRFNPGSERRWRI